MSLMNIRETDLMKYIVDEFNKNSLKIEFRMGTYDGDDENGLIVYAPPRDNDGRFDEKYLFNEETYAVTKKSMVVMGIDSMNGEYMPLPDIGLASYDFSLRFLVYADSPIYQVIGMAIREVRDRFVGKVSLLEVEDRDIENLDPNAPLKTEILNIVTSANSIDFGSAIEIRKRTYLQYTFNLEVIVSKNVDFGNQFEWKIGKVVDIENAIKPNRQPTLEDIDQDVVSVDGSIWSVSQFDNTNWFYKSSPLVMHSVIPLISSWGTAQDQESFQTLRPFANINSQKHKEIHNFVKSRGFAITFTFTANSKDYIKRELFKETFKRISRPNLYKIEMRFKQIEDDGSATYPEDMVLDDRTYILEEAQPSDVEWNSPVTFVVSFSPSAKKEY